MVMVMMTWVMTRAGTMMTRMMRSFVWFAEAGAHADADAYTSTDAHADAAGAAVSAADTCADSCAIVDVAANAGSPHSSAVVFDATEAGAGGFCGGDEDGGGNYNTMHVMMTGMR